MPITFNDLTVNFSHLKAVDILSDWRWLIGSSKQPILLAAMGNAFIQDTETGEVSLLDVGPGELRHISNTFDEFDRKLNDKEFVAEEFCLGLIVALRDRNITLSKGQIYSFKVSPAVGGRYSLDNIEPTDIEVHFSILGQIRFQTKELPPGTPINSVNIT